MGQWFPPPQFALRSLLALTTVACLLGGGRHLLVTFGQYVEAMPARIGQPIAVKGQLVRFGGRRVSNLQLDGLPPENAIRPVVDIYAIKRSWGCIYRFETTVCPINKAGEYPLSLHFQAERDGYEAHGMVTVVGG